MNLCKKQHWKISAVQDSSASGKGLGTIILPTKLLENLPDFLMRLNKKRYQVI